jgi:hypothetical protein
MPMASFSTEQNKIKISKTIGLLTLPLKDRMIKKDDFFPQVDHLIFFVLKDEIGFAV